MEIFRIENLSFSYPNSDFKAIEDVNLSVNSGEFVVLCGKSGCGKTTLLRLLKPEILPFGNCDGQIYFKNKPLSELSQRDSATKIGFVLQNPETQIVTDKVVQELAFGLENIGTSPEEIWRKIAEISDFFGIDGWISKDTSQLSGGQKQILSLASVMILKPDVIILDEPSSQLDPISANNFFTILRQINEQFGTTIILCEHSLEECFSFADKVIYMENGKVKFVETPQSAGEKLYNSTMYDALPSSVKIFGGYENIKQIPLNIKEGREIIRENFSPTSIGISEFFSENEHSISLKNIWFRYEKNAPDVLKGVSLSAKKGEILSILGGNGAGKTTLLKVISKIVKPYRCKGNILDKPYADYKSNSLYKSVISVLSQDPRTVFTAKTIREDYEKSCKAFDLDTKETISVLASQLKIENLLDRHPLDLSGGELQKCALGRVLISQPKILLLDEPTKGLDAFSKAEIGQLLKNLACQGITILIVTHDVEFSAEYSDECCLLFQGEIVSRDCPQKFFSENFFYTTSARKIARGTIENAVTVSQVRDNLREVLDES